MQKNKTKQTGLGRHPLTKKEHTMKYTYEIVASKLPVGLTNEREIIRHAGTVLEGMGLAPIEVYYHMNIDEDFLMEVLNHYSG